MARLMCRHKFFDDQNKRKILWQRLIKVLRYFSALLVCLYVRSVFAGTDDLSGLTDSMKGDFGSGSTFIHILYLIEVLTALYAYIKTKNIAVLGGIVVISLFVNFAFGHWVFPS